MKIQKYKKIIASVVFLVVVGISVAPSLILAQECASGSTCKRAPSVGHALCGAGTTQTGTCTEALPGGGNAAGICCAPDANAAAPVTDKCKDKKNLQECYSEYRLEYFPGFEEETDTFPKFLLNIYRFALWAVGICALFMLMVGGFTYMTSAGNNASMGTAKNIIRDSLIGLAMVFFAWLLLFVINPDLVKIEDNLSSLTQNPVNLNTTGAQGGEGSIGPFTNQTPSSPPPADAQGAAAAVLSSSNITLRSGGDCSGSDGTVSPQSNISEVANGKSMTTCHRNCSNDCSRSSNPSGGMLQIMLTVANDHAYTVTSIAGGSHSASSSHYTGNAIDIVLSGGSSWRELRDSFVSAGAKNSTFCEGREAGNTGCSSSTNHIHVVF